MDHTYFPLFEPSRKAARTGRAILLACSFYLCLVPAAEAQIFTVTQLIEAINDGSPNDEIVIGEGIFELTQTLRPKEGMTIRGAGQGKTILQGASSWSPGVDNLPENQSRADNSVNPGAYLFALQEGITDVTITGMTLLGPQLHGAVLGIRSDRLELADLHIEDFLWSGIRTYVVRGLQIHDNTLIDAGGKYKGVTGGAMYLTYSENLEAWNNTIVKSPEFDREFFGIKGYQARNSRIHHNTIRTGFSIEFPFAGSRNVEIDHNYLVSVISIPKYEGGEVLTEGFTFHIHHNYTKRSYSIEGPRNALEIDHNLFDFSVNSDNGNLFGVFDSPSNNAVQGPFHFHDNLVKNPGRGIFWSAEAYNNITINNNHVIANRTVTPRKEGFLGFNSNSDFSTVTIRDNIIECIGISRPLMRNEASYSANIINNRLIDVSDTDKYANPQTGTAQGPTERLYFTCGANEEYLVDQWDIRENDVQPPQGEDLALRYDYYEGSFSQVPDFTTLSPVSSGSVSNFDLSPRRVNDNFAFNFSGSITIPTTGTYTFYTTSDDGSQLFIDNQQVVDNDGLHAARERSGSVVLQAGQYPIRVTFFERTGGEKLEVRWEGPGLAKQLIPDEVLLKSNPAETTITIHAAGKANSENMALLIDGKEVASWINIGGNASTREFVTYTYRTAAAVSASQVRVNFPNDDGQVRDLRVDKLVINGTTYQSEATTTFSTGSWTPDNGCNEGFKQSEWLNCPGYFAYDRTESPGTALVRTESTLSASGSTVAIYPNPSSDEVSIRYQGNTGDGVSLQVLDLKGRQLQPQVDLPASHLLRIDTHLWPAGVYLVRVYRGAETSVHRLVITR